jgi:aryl-alcohol dehydrogenase-like predicted oxidoreductase
MSLPLEQREATKLLHAAADAGINFFDTADLYNKGDNEKLVGTAFKEKRNDILIATKVGNQWRSDGSGWDWNPRKAYILEAVEKSLQRLQTDRIDLYQLHGGTIEDTIDETIEAFELLKQQGKILHYGISSIRPNVIREYVNRSRIASVMMQYSLLDRRPEEACLPLLQENNIGVLCRGALAQGLLAGKAAKPVLNHTADAVSKAAALIKELSDAKRTASQTAIQFTLQHPAITSAVIGIRTMEQLLDAINALIVSSLTKEEYDVLLKTIAPNFYAEHR